MVCQLIDKPAELYYGKPRDLISYLHHVTRDWLGSIVSFWVESESGLTPLHAAAKRGLTLKVKALLEADADVNADLLPVKRRLCRCPELNASQSPTRDVLCRFCESRPYKRGCKPLHLAAAGGHDACVRLLRTYGADGNAVDSDGKNALYLAAESGSTRSVMALLENYGKPVLSLPTKTDDTPLHECLRNGMTRCVQELVNSGALVSAVNKEKETPLSIAVQRDDLDMIEFMVLYGYRVDWSIELKVHRPVHRLLFPDKRVCKPEERIQLAELLIRTGAGDRETLLDILDCDSKISSPSGLMDAALDALDRLLPSDFVFRYGFYDSTYLPFLGCDIRRRPYEKKVQAYKERQCKVPSLMHLSRAAVRSSLRCCSPQELSVLPLPQNMRKYVFGRDYDSLKIQIDSFSHENVSSNPRSVNYFSYFNL